MEKGCQLCLPMRAGYVKTLNGKVQPPREQWVPCVCNKVQESVCKDCSLCRARKQGNTHS